MALSQARKKANAKYEAKAYDKTLIRLPKGRLDEVRAHIEPAGESLNGFINRAISETMERDGGGIPSRGPQKVSGASTGAGAVFAAQQAAEATGEAAPQFIARAVGSQAKRDSASLRMGLNPATGEKLKRED